MKSYEGSHIDSLTNTYRFHQLISDPTHLLPNSSSCIDLIFTGQPNLAIDSGVYPTLHSNCHHQIIFIKFRIRIIASHFANWKVNSDYCDQTVSNVTKMESSFFPMNEKKDVEIT